MRAQGWQGQGPGIKRVAATQGGMHLQLVVSLGGNRAIALLDSGATGNFIDTKYLRDTKIHCVKKPRSYKLESLGDKPIISQVRYGTEPTKMQIGEHTEYVSFDVTNLGKYDLVLGYPWLKRHNPGINWVGGKITQWNCDCPLRPEAQELCESHRMRERARGLATIMTNRASEEKVPKEEKRSIDRQDLSVGTISAKDKKSIRETIPKEYWDYEDLFEEPQGEQNLPPHQPWDHEIPLQEGQQPKSMPTYRLTEQQLAELRKYIDTNMEKGWIRPSSSSAGYPIIFVPKKDGSLRLCVDYRQLNEITKKNRYPLPLIEEIQDRFRGTTWFTGLDIRDAYHKIRIKEGEEWKTAFKTRFGLYEYLVMPFGLTNAPATFQALINDALYEYLDDFVTGYLDDILVFTKGTKEDHTEKVKKVLQRLQKYGLYLKPKKCEFFKKEIKFLGHIVTTEGIKMDPEKIQAILDWPTPTNVKEVQAFHGLANYYRQYITKFSEMVRPLVELFKKDETFEWNERREKAFQEVKDLFRNGDMRQHFDPEKPSTVDADASDCAIGARLQQPGPDGKLRLVACYSRSMTPAEQNYDIHDKELLAIVCALKKWKVELQGAKHQVTVLSDHHNLQYFTTTKELTRRQARWSETLSAYDFKIRHCKGKENAWADALSRRPDLMVKEKESKTLFRQEDQTKDMVLDQQALRATRVVTAEDSLLEDIKKETVKDEQAKRLRQNDNAIESDGMIIYHELAYVPKSLRHRVMQQGHDAPTSGHFGVDKTMGRITEEYYWPGMWNDIRDYIRDCETCQRNKADRHRPYGLLQPIPQLRKPWESVAMDFITKLPKSKEPQTGVEYDSILTITDRMTKYAYFIPFIEATTAPETAYVILRTVIANHGLPKEWITDRDPKFTSHFWTTLMEKLGVQKKMSTAYHPQTDGQAERMNQTVEQYLRCYLNYKQDNWVSLLPLAQIAYNSAKNATTGMTPYFANYGKEPEIQRQPFETTVKGHEAEISATELRKLHDTLRRDIEFLHSRMKQYYNLKRQEAPDFKRGEKVFLLRRNIKTKRPNEKFDHKKLGPFKIDEKIGQLNYKLQLPKTMRIHPTFHVSLLEKANQNARPYRTETPNDEQEYEVEKVLGKALVDGKEHYLIKWKGYPTSENTWEPTKHLRNAQQMIKDYHRENPRTEGRQDRGNQK